MNLLQVATSFISYFLLLLLRFSHKKSVFLPFRVQPITAQGKERKTNFWYNIYAFPKWENPTPIGATYIFSLTLQCRTAAVGVIRWKGGEEGRIVGLAEALSCGKGEKRVPNHTWALEKLCLKNETWWGSKFSFKKMRESCKKGRILFLNTASPTAHVCLPWRKVGGAGGTFLWLHAARSSSSSDPRWRLFCPQ